MNSSGPTTIQLQRCLIDLQAGEVGAREELIRVSQQRLLAIARRMFRQYNRLRAWEETDDVLQTALLRLHRSLAEISPNTVRGYLGLASLQIRRTLIDLSRHYFGPGGIASLQAHAPGDGPSTGWLEAAQAGSGEPHTLEDWTDFHERVASLADEHRELFDLLWYQGLTQAEAAEVLGISERSVRRNWFIARRRLHGRIFNGDEEP